MIKLLLILIVGLVFESTGVILLKKGMTHIGDMNGYTAAEIFRVVKAGVTNPQILLGVFFEALFFICLLILMSKSEISFLWPLTALSFVFATFAAIWFLGEQRFRHALDRGGFDHDWRGVHQLQPAREGNTRAANGQTSFGNAQMIRGRRGDHSLVPAQLSFSPGRDSGGKPGDPCRSQ